MRRKAKKSSGFTLVEVFIVLSIMAVLMAFLAGAAMRSRQKQKNAVTYVLINGIIAALEMYKEDFGGFPPDDTYANSSRSLYFYLSATYRKGKNADMNAGPYIQYDEDKNLGTEVPSACDIDGDGSTDDSMYDVVDGWGNLIVYDSSSPAHNTNSYDLYSTGPSANSGDDITNWD
jgi:prepilin-type N-terminal cleavage/methylation domain-containing protein